MGGSSYELLADPSAKNLSALQAVRRTDQRSARRCTNEYWQTLSINIQSCSDMGNIPGMYEGMKKAFGPAIRKVAPLKSKEGIAITDRTK